jgi:tetratricopeptide (TPR) repeat protein
MNRKIRKKEPQKLKLLPVMLVMLLLLMGVSGVEGAFEDIEIGARATSLAGAFVSQADDISGIFYNPAGLMRLKRIEVLTSYEKMYWGLSDNSNIGKQVAAAGMPLSIGSVGVGWQMLTLTDLYSEGVIKLGYSYGFKGNIYVGLGVSSLRVGYAQTAYTKINPVFEEGGYNKSSLGVDVGVMYEGNILDLGLAVMNVNEPDVGIRYENKAPRKINLGASLKQRVLNLNVATVISGGSFRIKTGIETWVFTRRVSLRGGINFGSMKYRNAAIGMGYRDSWYEVDYSFNYPLSGISDINGSHQLSMIFRFGGKPQEKAEEGFTWKELIDLAGGKMPARMGRMEVEISPQEIAQAQEYINKAKENFRTGRYGEAVVKLEEAKNILRDDKEVNKLQAKGKALVNIASEVKGRGRKQRLVRSAVDAYISENGKLSLDYIRYASQVYKNSGLVSGMKSLIESEFAEIAEKEKLVSGIDLVNQKLQEALELIYDGKYVSAIASCNEALRLEPRNVLALMRMGSAYWAMGMADRARQTWREALKIDPGNKQLMEFLKMKKKAKVPVKKAVKEKIKREPNEKVKNEYKNAMAYYNRVKRYGADKSTLKSILQRMADKFKNTGVDMRELNKELKKY